MPECARCPDYECPRPEIVEIFHPAETPEPNYISAPHKVNIHNVTSFNDETNITILGTNSINQNVLTFQDKKITIDLGHHSLSIESNNDSTKIDFDKAPILEEAASTKSSSKYSRYQSAHDYSRKRKDYGRTDYKRSSSMWTLNSLTYKVH